jgi:hypothetical protein
VNSPAQYFPFNPSNLPRKVFFILVGLVALSFQGCATMSDDDKTKAQGTVLGAVAGAVVGGGIGALTGLMVGQGRTEDIIIGAISGGVAGGMAGGVVGYQYGMAVAQRKAEYRNSEEFYISQIQEIDATTNLMKRNNAFLRQELRNLQGRRNALDQALAAGTLNSRSYRQELASMRSYSRALRQNAAPATDLVNFQRAVLDDAQTSGASGEIAEELIRASSEQEEAYAPLEKTLNQLEQVGKPTRG